MRLRLLGGRALTDRADPTSTPAYPEGFAVRTRTRPARLAPTVAALAALVLAPRAFAPHAFAEDPPAAPASVADPAAARKIFEEAEVLREEMKWDKAAERYAQSLDKDEGSWIANLRYQEAVLAVGAKGNLQQEVLTLKDEYDKAVAGRPADPAARIHRLRLEAPADRLPVLVRDQKASPLNPVLLLELGRAHLALGDAASARKPLEAALPGAPDRTEALLLLCEALRRFGDATNARTRLEAEVAQRGDFWDAHLALARLDLLEEKHEDALKRAAIVLSLRPSHLPAMLLMSEASSRLKKPEDALQALEKALRVTPECSEAMVAWADLTAKAGTPEALKRAVEAYTKALGHGGGFRAQYGLGWAQERLGLLPEAEKSYGEARLLAPSDPAVLNSIGYVLLRQKKFTEASGKFRQAIALAPEWPDAYANLASVLEEQGDWNEAIKTYQRLFRIKGQDKNVRALVNCAFDYEALSTYQKGQELLEKARALRPQDSEIATFLGDNLYFQHKWKLAIKAYKDAVGLDDKNRFAWRGLGASLAMDDKAEDAVAALEKSKALKADDANVLLLLGDLYVIIENPEKAVENYEAYVKAGGGDPDVPRLIEELKKEIEAKK